MNTVARFPLLENLLYRTPLSGTQAMARLAENVSAQKPVGFLGITPYAHKPYVGTVTDFTFKISRAITHRNSFLPVIKGEVVTDYEGTKIKVSMRPPFYGRMAMIAWFSFALVACLGATVKLFREGFSPFFFFAFGILLLGIFVVYVLFTRECAISKKDLRRIFEAEPESVSWLGNHIRHIRTFKLYALYGSKNDY